MFATFAMLVTLAVSAQAGPLAAAPASPAVTAAPPKATVKAVDVVASQDPDRDDPVICHSIEVTGSMFTERQCLHQSQWTQESRDAQDTYSSFSSGGAIIPDGPTGKH